MPLDEGQAQQIQDPEFLAALAALEPAGAGWLDKAGFKFALRHAGRLYPPRLILSLATGIPRTEFSGDKCQMLSEP